MMNKELITSGVVLPVGKEFLITDISINEDEHRAYFTDYVGKNHSLKLKVDKLNRYYIVYKNKHIYFIVHSSSDSYTIAPAYRNGNEVVTLSFNKCNLNDERESRVFGLYTTSRRK